MNDEVKFHFDDHFQLGIFEMMMNDVSFCEKAVATLKATFFKNQFYAWFFDKNKELMESYGSAPTHLQIRNEIMRFAPDKQQIYLEIFVKITKPHMQRDYAYIRTNLEEFVKKAMRFQLNEILVKNQNRSSDEIDKLIEEQFNEYTSVNFGNTQCQSIGQLSSIVKQAAEDSKNLIPTYLPTIDKALGGGVPRGTLTLGLSGTNVGKSIWLVNWAFHLMKDKKKVFYVNLEGYKNQTILRLATRAIGCKYGDLRNGGLNDVDAQKKLKFEEKYKDSIQILHDSTFGYTIEDLVAVARQKKTEFDYDVLMVDYGQIMGAKKQYKELRHEQAYVYRGLSSLAGELDVAVVTVAQGNRQTQEKNQGGKGLIHMADISECFEIVRACATVITLNRSEQDIEMDTARALLDKSRDGATNAIEVMRTNFSRMAFFGTSAEQLGFMDMNSYTSEMSKVKG